MRHAVCRTPGCRHEGEAVPIKYGRRAACAGCGRVGWVSRPTPAAMMLRELLRVLRALLLRETVAFLSSPVGRRISGLETIEEAQRRRAGAAQLARHHEGLRRINDPSRRPPGAARD